MAHGPACPALQRVLKTGCKGGDVLALQRAMYPALHARGGEATNQRTGQYGSRTVDDVRAFQRSVGLDASGNVGTNTFVRLWNLPYTHPAGAFDELGVELIFRVKLRHPTTLEHPLRKGDKGPLVRAAQQMLWRALAGDSVNLRNSIYGAGVEQDLALYHRRAGYHGRPTNVIAQDDWVVMWGFTDGYARMLATTPSTDESDPAVIRARIRSWAEWYVVNRLHIGYGQVRPYPMTAHLPLTTDCSGSACSILHWAGAPNDPNGLGWSGQGFTGTMQGRGERLEIGSRYQPGDCLFYGDQGGGVAEHVIIVCGPDDRAMSFGGWPPQFVWASSYWLNELRHDIGARRYFG